MPKHYCNIILLVGLFINLKGQNALPVNLKDDKLTPARYEINTKRIGVEFTSKDALTSSREFIRLDPNYYVGHLYEGAYKYNIASDIIGYVNAIIPLELAKQKIEKDYKKDLKTRTSDIAIYFPIITLHRDYDYLIYALQNAYTYSDQQEKAWAVMRDYQKINLQDENFADSYNSMAWQVHRNRFYTKEKYSFLKDNIDENEKYSIKLLDSGIKKAQLDHELNKNFYSNYLEGKLFGIYHYKSLLYCYNLQLDSATKYYNLLKETPYFPANNYATFCNLQGKFKEAAENYKQAANNTNYDKRLEEYAYYTTILDVYSNNPKHSIAYMQEIIKTNGSTPGYGWYNIGLARSLLYDGQFENAKNYINKAASFKEVHIGTTLGQSHYDFSTNLLKLISIENEIKSIKYFDKYWWFKPKKVWNWLTLFVEKFTIQYFIINQFANNPERDSVVYKIFSSESTVSFDEVWYLIKDFSTKFFIKKFESSLAAEKRPRIKKYFKLFLAKLYIKEGDMPKARSLLKEIKNLEEIDKTYEQLFKYRLAEAELSITTNQVQKEKIQDEMYALYPQLTPFSGLAPKISLHISGNSNKTHSQIIKNLKQANIIWADTGTTNNLFIQFQEQKDLHIIQFNLVNTKGIMTTSIVKFSYTNIDEAAKILKLACCNIGNASKQINSGEIEKEEAKEK
jgi:hypothetical protein